MNRTILLVEDDENDVFFLNYVFEAVGILNSLHVAADGQEAPWGSIQLRRRVNSR